LKGTVLVVLHEPEKSGPARGMLAVTESLEELGWRFAFWTPRPGPLYDELMADGRTALGCERPIRFSWSSLRERPGIFARGRALPPYLREFRAALRAVAPVLVHAHTLLTIPEALIARSSGYRTLVHVHETLPWTAKGRVAAELLRIAADSVVTVSRAAAAALARAGVDATIAYPSVLPQPSRRANARAGRELIVGTIGTISRRKGSDLFLEMAEGVRCSYPDVAFRVVGRVPAGREHAWGAAMAARLEQAGIEIRGEVPDIAGELATWDVFVLPSRDDPFPAVVLEAMAGRLPVVAAAVGGTPEQITPETGILVAPGDPGAMANAVVRLLGDPDRRRRLGDLGRERLVDVFLPDRYVAELDRIYRTVAAA
jgi:glycosyltransferase involved in cell wall biosynthesis